jgi:hypothetical protein
MSILKPKNGDYITRGILLLLGWFTLGWAPFCFLGAVIFSLLFGPQAALPGATVFFGVYIPLGVGLYWIFLEWSAKHS